MLKATKVSALTLGLTLAGAQLLGCSDDTITPNTIGTPAATDSMGNPIPSGSMSGMPGQPSGTSSMGMPSGQPTGTTMPTVIVDPMTGMTTVVDVNPSTGVTTTATVDPSTGMTVTVDPTTGMTVTVPPNPTGTNPMPTGTMPAGTGGMGMIPDPVGGGGMDMGAGGMPMVGGDAPPGYWTYGDWHGCSWTGTGTYGTTTITPQDFTAQAASEPYCVSGSVGEEPEYRSVALLGFNVNEPTSASCASRPVDVNAAGPPSTAALESGIAFDFVKQGANTAFTLRVQLQGPNGHKEGAEGEADRWCATITEVQGKVFVPYSSFTPKCWEMDAAAKGTPYSNQPISAVVFLVPGSLTATPFDFCVNGFAYGNSAEDAPSGTAVAGDQTGTVGGTGSDDLDFDREKVVVDGENYIIQNNNWGNSAGSDCILSFLNNSFTVTSCTGSGQSAPAAFPSIYIGANGNTANGVYSTSTTDNLPIQISAIQSIQTTFRYSGGGGSYNATYDIWFANSPPSGQYEDGIDGFAMVWLRDPGDRQPIGSQMGSTTIAGQSWNIWVGPRGDGPAGYNDAPVVSFTNPTQDDNSRAQSFVNVNLLEFINAATQVGGGLSSSMYLTDVFAGFEIWNGGTGLKVDEFKAVVTPN